MIHFSLDYHASMRSQVFEVGLIFLNESHFVCLFLTHCGEEYKKKIIYLNQTYITRLCSFKVE